MLKSHREDLRKKYPQEFFNISEKDGRVIITKKKRKIWVRQRWLASLPKHDSEELSQDITKAIELFEKDIKKEYFKQAQVYVTKELADKIAKKAKSKGVRQLTYLTAVLE
jgi:hypothetical protein